MAATQLNIREFSSKEVQNFETAWPHLVAHYTKYTTDKAHMNKLALMFENNKQALLTAAQMAAHDIKPSSGEFEGMDPSTGFGMRPIRPDDLVPTAQGRTFDAPKTYAIASLLTASSWLASTAYSLNDEVEPTTINGYVYKATTGGTSSATEPTWPTTVGGTVTDGTVVWTCEARYVGTAGDVSADFAVGEQFTISGSTGNNGTYTITAVAFSTPNTLLTVAEAVPDDTADGSFERIFTANNWYGYLHNGAITAAYNSSPLYLRKELGVALIGFFSTGDAMVDEMQLEINSDTLPVWNMLTQMRGADLNIFEVPTGMEFLRPSHLYRSQIKINTSTGDLSLIPIGVTFVSAEYARNTAPTQPSTTAP